MRGRNDAHTHLLIYKEQTKRKLCDPGTQKVNDRLYLSLFRGLTLKEYIAIRTLHCKMHHKQPCTSCDAMLYVAQAVSSSCFKKLSEVFQEAFPKLTYKSDIARQRLLQIPLVCVRIGAPTQVWYLVEFVEGVDYMQFIHFASALQSTKSTAAAISSSEVKSILSLAQSDRERELIRYSVFKASGLSSTAARKAFGFQDMNERSRCVEGSIDNARHICEAINSMARTRDKAILLSMGVEVCMSESDSESEDSEPLAIDGDRSIDSLLLPDRDNDSDASHSSIAQDSLRLPQFCEMQDVLEASQYNWFCVVEYVESKSRLNCSIPSVKEHLDNFYTHILYVCSPSESVYLKQSFYAFQVTLEADLEKIRIAAAYNSDVVTESEDEDNEQITSLASEKAKEVIARKRMSLARQVRRQKAKALTDQRFLSRTISKKMKNVVDKFPDIGKTIEAFVEASNVGVDAWRRTGVLTFDGNRKLKNKVTYSRIQAHLQEIYGQSFSYGTVVQLCVARNKRHRAAKNYRGVARVTSRRARKGFELRYNPDSHWSAALYKGLNFIQFTDGTEITNINRDDACGYRLDTLARNSQHRTLVVDGRQTVTTYTDYVSKYPSILQTTSYNFSQTQTTGELCAGVVKAQKIFPKNPAQHYADLLMLETVPELQPAFINPKTQKPKIIECNRVDGASDEGPSHEEVMFWWTLHHLESEKLVTMLSARSSGASHLNRVELQNGCLTLGHSNLFIPSTLCGSCVDSASGNIDEEKLRANLDLATDIYISRTNGCPCGDTTIQLLKGADSTDYQNMRPKLQVFLKGSKKKELKKSQPNLFEYFSKVWNVRTNHMLKDYPPQYLFILKCCFMDGCPHPLCMRGPPEVDTWFPDGPSLDYIPLPVPDPAQFWGNPNCQKCTGFCAGHFLDAKDALP